MRLACLVAVCLLGVTLPVRADDGVVTIHVVPVGAVPADVLEELSFSLKREYAAAVVVQPPIALPAAETQGGHRRQQGERLLTLVDEQLSSEQAPGVRILGVTAADIWAAKEDQPARSVSGLAQFRGRAALVSTFRLRQAARDRAQVPVRVSNHAVHQLGHTFGLAHCDEPRCVMMAEPAIAAGAGVERGHLGRQCRGAFASPLDLTGGSGARP